jgi:DNA-binding MarR family transcriptional regulator
LYRDKTLTAKELSDICEEDKASISRSIDYLEKNGFITCSSATVKRYKAPLLLTEKGETVAKRVSDKIEKILEKAGEGLEPANRQVLYEGLDLICNNLDKLCENY